MQVNYRFYATLLDSFQYYLSKVDDDNAFQDFIDRLNRKPFYSEAAVKGTAFNELVDKVISGEVSIGDLETDKKGNVLYSYAEGDEVKNFPFKPEIVRQFASQLRGAIPQKYVEAVLSTNRGNVLLYGFIDEILMDKVIDIKTTGRYEFPKYLHAYQSKVYPYCLSKNGVFVDRFEYLITDFRNIYIEEYPYKPERDITELQRFSEQLIDFIENHMGLIDTSDPKVARLFNAEAL